MVPKKEKQASFKPRNGLTFVAWLLFGLLIVSGCVNLITILSVQGLKKTVNEMREPVNNYFSKKLDLIEVELREFVKKTAAEDGKSPYRDEVKQLRKDVEETRGLWAKTSQANGARWVSLFWKAQRAHEKTEQAWEELKAMHSP